MNKWWTVLACLVYVLSPVDLVPEVVLGPLGLADDAVVAVLGLRALVRRPQ